MCRSSLLCLGGVGGGCLGGDTWGTDLVGGGKEIGAVDLDGLGGDAVGAHGDDMAGIQCTLLGAVEGPTDVIVAVLIEDGDRLLCAPEHLVALGGGNVEVGEGALIRLLGAAFGDLFMITEEPLRELRLVAQRHLGWPGRWKLLPPCDGLSDDVAVSDFAFKCDWIANDL